MADGSQSGRPFRRGWVQKGDKLLMFEDERLLVLRAWPDVRAWVKLPGKVFRGFRPVEPLLLYIGRATHPRYVQRALHAFKKSESGSAATPETIERIRAGFSAKQRAAQMFVEAFPAELWSLAGKLERRQWHLLALLSRVPGVDELARDNLALAFAMASCWVFADRMTQPYRTARRMARRRRVEIVEWLGFPSRPVAVRVLSKLRPDAISVRRLLYLREALRAEAIPKALLHLPVLDSGTLRILTDPVLRPFAAHSLLEELATDPHESEALAYILEDTRTMALQLDVRPAPVRSVRELRGLHDELARQINRGKLVEFTSMAIPPPPFAGTDVIVPLDSAIEIAAEGRQMHHCVFSYVPQVADGQVYLYRVLGPERATFSLRRTHDGWGIGQIRGPTNARVRAETVECVHQWLTAQQGVAAEILRSEGFSSTAR